MFAPGEKFFVRRVPLAPDGDAAAQVALALESLSPFPAGQLYYGFRLDPSRTEALVFAAYRKNFTPEEIAGWPDAAAVLPAFAVWLGAAAAPAAGISLRDDSGRWEVIAWDGKSSLPAAVLVQTKEVGDRDAMIAEVGAKAGLAVDVPVKELRGAVETTREKGELILRLTSGGASVQLDGTSLGLADIRDKAVLLQRRATQRRDTLLWRGFATILAGLAACVVLELGELATRFWLVGQQSVINARAPLAKRIELAQSMAKRLEEISTQRLLPFEMLAEIYAKRPASIQFISVTTKGLWEMDLQAESTNADDPASFESDVRKLPGIERVEVPEKRAREGVTVFSMQITFKPGWYHEGGA